MSGAGFARLMAGLDAPLSVVTTVVGDERAGCLVGFHAQTSIHPTRYTVWLSKANHTCRVGLRAEHFAVHFLDRSQGEVAELFGTTTGDQIDKFSRCRWTAGPDGVPVLDDCPNRFVARRVALLDEGGDHVCLVLDPVSVSCDEGLRPLRLSHVPHLDAGHEVDERPQPPTERAL